MTASQTPGAGPAGSATLRRRLTAELRAMNLRLADLEDRLGAAVLDNTALEGVTQERRAETADLFTGLWARYEEYRVVVERVQALLGHAPPTDADQRRAEALASEAVEVQLPGRDGTEPLSRQVTLGQLATEFDAGCHRIQRTLAAVDTVRTELDGRLDGCAELLGAARELAGQLGIDPAEDPAPGGLSELDGRLHEVRRRVRTDPLRFWAGSAVAAPEVDQLETWCHQAATDLGELVRVRDDAASRLNRVDARLVELAGLHRDIVDERRRAVLKIRQARRPAGSSPAAGPSAAALRSRLAPARELCLHGHWRRLAAELPALEQDTEAAVTRHREELARARRPLQERDELRGKLRSYRAKAAARGLVEDLALEEAYQRAHDLLWSAPCDLVAAAAAVIAYQDSVNRAVTSRGPA